MNNIFSDYWKFIKKIPEIIGIIIGGVLAMIIIFIISVILPVVLLFLPILLALSLHWAYIFTGLILWYLLYWISQQEWFEEISNW
jgi:hypothetical protein